MSGPLVLLLAAGHSERWRAAGGTGHKLETPLGDATVFSHALTRALASGCEAKVCVSAATPASVLTMCRMLQAATIQTTGGMGDVIAQAVRAAPSKHGWLILPADMPCIEPRTIRTVADALQENTSIAAPFFERRRGHPVAFASQLRDQLVALSGDHGARDLLAQHVVKQVPVQDAGILLDVDTPRDLHEASHTITSSRAG